MSKDSQECPAALRLVADRRRHLANLSTVHIEKGLNDLRPIESPEDLRSQSHPTALGFLDELGRIERVSLGEGPRHRGNIDG